MGFAEELRDPSGELFLLLIQAISVVGEDHDAIVILSSDDTAETLGRLPDGVKGEKFALGDLIILG